MKTQTLSDYLVQRSTESMDELFRKDGEQVTVEITSEELVTVIASNGELTQIPCRNAEELARSLASTLQCVISR